MEVLFMPLPALSSTQLPEAIPDWTPLDRKRVLEHFMLSRDYENIAEYISFQSDLLPDERVILFFLHAVYANSTKTIELYGTGTSLDFSIMRRKALTI